MRELFTDQEYDRLLPAFKNFVSNADIGSSDLDRLKEIRKADIEAIYGFAYGFYEAGQYSESLTLFILLTSLRMKERRFWKGLGACFQLLKRYEEAVEAFGSAALLDEELKDPYPHFHAAECLISLKKKKKALIALKSAKFIANKESCHLALKKRVEVLEKIHA